MGTTQHRAPALVLIAPVALAGPSLAFGFATADPHLASTYFGARYCQANLGRFTTVDPVMDKDAALKNPQLWNRYAYGNNNPLKFVDPDGNAAIAIPQARLKANAELRATVHLVISTGPGIGYDPQIAAFGVDLVLGMFMPATRAEYAAQIEGAAFGMVAPLAGAEEAAVSRTFDQARREAFEHAQLLDPSDVRFTKVDPSNGTVVEFKGPGGAKVAYDGPHPGTPGAAHETQHVGWRAAGKRSQGAGAHGNIPYEGPQHPSRTRVKGSGTIAD